MFVFNCYLLACFVLLKFTENSKKIENWNEQVFVPIRILVRIILTLDIFCHFIFMHCPSMTFHSMFSSMSLSVIISIKSFFGMPLQIFQRRILLRVTLVFVKEY